MRRHGTHAPAVRLAVLANSRRSSTGTAGRREGSRCEAAPEGPHARRTLCTLSVRPRAPTKQMGPYRRPALLGAVLFERKRRVRTAKTESIAQRDLDFLRARLVRDVVEVAVWIGLLVVHRRRQDAMVEREGRRDGLDAPGGAKEMPGHGLGGRDRELLRVLPEDALDRDRLELVVVGRGRAVRVDVADGRGLEGRVAERGRHRPGGAVAFWIRRGHVV